MDAGKPLRRRTCTSCRKWFHAKPSAATTQKTCSVACRAVRRAMLARHRRERSLQDSRVAERERQQACRARRRAGGQAVTRRVLSRATLPPEMAGIRAEILARVDHAARLSRATLDRQLRGILGAIGPMVDQAGP
jgi:hypothetical protein